VLTVSGDVYRPAAIEQLKTVTAQAGAEWFPSTPTRNRWTLPTRRWTTPRKHYFDVLLVDTAGRLAIDEALMKEIKDLHAAINPIETLFVVDAMQGQDAINTAKAFKEALAAHRHRADQAGRRLARWCGAVGAPDHRRAHQVCGCVRKRSTASKCSTPNATRAASWAWATSWRWWSRSRPGVDMEAAQKLAAKVKSGDGFDLNDFWRRSSR
jgi:signal recognition particle subunit SRP54